MFLFGFGEGTMGPDPLVLLMAALLVDAYLGDMALLFRYVPHPVVLIGRLIDFFDRKLNREDRTTTDRGFRGALTVLTVAGVAGGAGWLVAWVGRNHPLGWLPEFLLVVTLIAQRGLHDHVRAVGLALKTEGVEAGRDAVSHIVGRDPAQLDGSGVARAAIESLAENFSDGVAAPVFWYVLFGLPGLCVYKAVNTMDSMIGHKSPRYRAFGMTAARLDDVLNLLPARLSGLFLVLASLVVPTANPAASLRVMLRDAGKHRSPNAGWPEGAMAGALGLSLAGPRKYHQLSVDDPWIGEGRTQADHQDIRRALYLFWVACLINGLMVASVAVLRMAA